MIIFFLSYRPYFIGKNTTIFSFHQSSRYIFSVESIFFYNLNDYLTHFAFSSPQKVRHTLFFSNFGV